jgi:hypothetical protein
MQFKIDPMKTREMIFSDDKNRPNWLDSLATKGKPDHMKLAKERVKQQPTKSRTMHARRSAMYDAD